MRFGRRVVFAGLNAEFLPGKTTALVGPSGSGKSTLLSAMAGFRVVDSGRVSLVDETLISPSPSYVAWVPQGANALGARTALDNVRVSALANGLDEEAATRIALRCLAEVGIDGLAARPAKELSGGELQRLSLARALASERPIILADEPSASLDRGNTEMLARLFRTLRAEATIVIATHDPVLVESADDVVDMRRE